MIRTVATFESDRFNLKENRDYFINEGCFGDDLGRWLIERLCEAGAHPDTEPGQEDFGWYVNFSAGGQRYCVVIGNVSAESWYIVVEREHGLLGSLFGARNRAVPAAGVELVHRVLSAGPEIRNLRWHYWSRFETGDESAFGSGARSPASR